MPRTDLLDCHLDRRLQGLDCRLAVRVRHVHRGAAKLARVLGFRVEGERRLVMKKRAEEGGGAFGFSLAGQPF